MANTTLEEHLHTHCPNCGKDHEAKFLSHFTEDKHYIVGNCENCGYRIEFRRDDLGSGLFLPDGSVSTIHEVFRSKHVEHVREALREQNVPPIVHSFAGMRVRLIDPKHEAKKEEKK